MTPVDFPQRTHIVGENQPEYTPLPVHININPGNNSYPFTCCFELSEAEIAELMLTKKLWFTQLTFGNRFQPIHLSTQNPFERIVTMPQGTEPGDKVIEAEKSIQVQFVEQLAGDPELQRAWRDNIAMAFQDAFVQFYGRVPHNDPYFHTKPDEIHTVANNAADNFMRMLTR